MMESAVTDLPEPDSPTSASVSPSSMVNETPRTACTVPWPVLNSTCRLSMASSGPVLISLASLLNDCQCLDSRDYPNTLMLSYREDAVIARDEQIGRCGERRGDELIVVRVVEDDGKGRLGKD